MTIIFTTATTDLIAMTVDSAITLTFSSGSAEYSSANKAYEFPGIGCVATWGCRDHNKIGTSLNSKNMTAENHTVEDLANFVADYLVKEYRPHELGCDDVGYHVAGFDKKGQPRLYHIFWGMNRPSEGDETRHYRKEEYHPLDHNLHLYNGRNDIAGRMIGLYIEQLNSANEVRFDLGKPLGIIQLGDFIARFAAEITPEVGKPFITYILNKTNHIEKIKNDTFCRVEKEEVVKVLQKLGY